METPRRYGPFLGLLMVQKKLRPKKLPLKDGCFDPRGLGRLQSGGYVASATRLGQKQKQGNINHQSQRWGLSHIRVDIGHHDFLQVRHPLELLELKFWCPFGVGPPTCKARSCSPLPHFIFLLFAVLRIAGPILHVWHVRSCLFSKRGIAPRVKEIPGSSRSS